MILKEIDYLIELFKSLRKYVNIMFILLLILNTLIIYGWNQITETLDYMEYKQELLIDEVEYLKEENSSYKLKLEEFEKELNNL